MLGSSEVSKTLGLVFEAEGVVNDARSAFAADAQSDQNSHSWKVAFDKVRGSVKWINPNNCVLSVKSLKRLALNFVCSIGLLKTVVNKLLSLTLVLIKELSCYEIFQRVCDLIWPYGWLDILN